MNRVSIWVRSFRTFHVMGYYTWWSTPQHTLLQTDKLHHHGWQPQNQYQYHGSNSNVQLTAVRKDNGQDKGSS